MKKLEIEAGADGEGLYRPPESLCDIWPEISFIKRTPEQTHWQASSVFPLPWGESVGAAPLSCYADSTQLRLSLNPSKIRATSITISKEALKNLGAHKVKLERKIHERCCNVSLSLTTLLLNRGTLPLASWGLLCLYLHLNTAEQLEPTAAILEVSGCRHLMT